MITYSDAKNPVYADEGNKIVSLLVKFDHLPDYIEFHAVADDCEEHGRKLYQEACNGNFGIIAKYVAPVVSKEEKLSFLKIHVANVLNAKAVEAKFNSFADALTYCDEATVPEYAEKAKALRAYRSKLKAWVDSIEALPDFDYEDTVESLPSM